MVVIRRKSAAYPQDIRNVLHSELLGNPRLFRRFSSPFAQELHQENRLRFSAAFSQRLRRN
jgi:hypothetical protein